MRHGVNKTIARIAAVAFICCMFASFMPVNIAQADVPYKTYSYDYWGKAVYQPQAYLYRDSFTDAVMGTSLSYPEDMFITEDTIYVADTGNSRILLLGLDGSLKAEVTAAESSDDMLRNPKGIFVSNEGHLYVADSGNGRIVEYDEQLNWLRSIGRPETDLIDETLAYTPTGIVADKAGRMYVIAYGINMGLLEFDKNGDFQGFMGATEVSVSMFDYVKKNYFSTDEQKKRMETIVPTEYSNIFIDEKNFIYATISNLTDDDHKAGADMIRRLNPTGTDVLRRLGNNGITGDLFTASDDAKWSNFTDVWATDYGCYFILDSASSKVYAYDYDGNSMFVFGDSGSREGTGKKVRSIGLRSDCSELFILDTMLGCILRYEITEYGSHFLAALEKNNRGDAEGSFAEWQTVLSMNSNCELAYIGIGKTYLKQGRYKDAMEYFKLGNSRKYYSTAFYYYRKELMQKYFPKAMLVIGIVLVIWALVAGIRRFRRWVGEVRCIMEKQ